MKNYWISLFLIFLAFQVSAQFQIQTQVLCEDTVRKEMNISSDILIFSSVTEANTFLEQILKDAMSQGYIAACYDSLSRSDSLITANFNRGPLITFASVQFRNFSPESLKKAGINPDNQKHSLLNAAGIQKIMENTVIYYENNGYPFVRVSIDSIFYRNDTVWTILNCTQGPAINIDTIINNGNLDVHPEVLFALVNIFPGDPYNESATKSIGKRIRNQRFITETSPVSVSFKENGAIVYLNLDKKPVNTFDGIVGFMPDYMEEGKLFLTGELMLSVTNALNLTEHIYLKWRQPSKQSQDLKSGISFPWLIYIPLGFSWDFLLLKRDTTYVNVENKFTLFYSANLNSRTGAYLHYMNSNLLSVSSFQQLNTLPPVHDMNIISVGIRSDYSKLDNLTNPSKGFELHFDISAGKKTILKNPALNETLYEGLQSNDIRIQIENDMALHIPIQQRSSIYLRNYTGFKSAKQLFINELFTIGGLQNLRGFDENRFYASLFGLQTIEYRYRFDVQSRLIVFSDFAYIEKQIVTEKDIQRPMGFGAGISFDTNQGIFSLFYAVGKTHQQPLSIKSSKIHLGYVIIF